MTDPAEKMVDLKVQCMTCKKIKEIELPHASYMRWLRGTPIQDALPRVHAGDRELLISQTCNECFDRLTGDLE